MEATPSFGVSMDILSASIDFSTYDGAYTYLFEK